MKFTKNQKLINRFIMSLIPKLGDKTLRDDSLVGILLCANSKKERTRSKAYEHATDEFLFSKDYWGALLNNKKKGENPRTVRASGGSKPVAK